jgi:O-acetyl-ADP-ribose deacetylase (regulator of RNase III)
MKIIKGNILDIKEGFICHQVNCKGSMGAGIALQIRRKWPHVYEDYRNAFHKGLLFLGNVVESEITPDLYVAHLCGQYDYGRKPGRVYTEYAALAEAMLTLVAGSDRRPIYVPYGMGCGFAGGDWKIVSRLIDKLMPSAVVVKLG